MKHCEWVYDVSTCSFYLNNSTEDWGGIGAIFEKCQYAIKIKLVLIQSR